MPEAVEGYAAAVRLGRRLGIAFFDRPCLDVAPELVGCTLVRRLPGGERLVGRIVEVEAYLGDGSDPAAHSHIGPTPRNRAMFGPAGRLYVYRSYGLHWCANVVCEGRGRGAAVLLRALEPLQGDAWMRRRRGLRPDAPARLVAGGPGRLAQALAIDDSLYGASLASGPLSLHRGSPAARPAHGPRIGIRKAAALPYRFFDSESPCLSRP